MQVLNDHGLSDSSNTAATTDFRSLTPPFATGSRAYPVASLIPVHTAVTAMALEDLCVHLATSSDASSCKILRIICRADARGLKHKFLLVEAKEPFGNTLWFRLERAADLTQPRGWFSKQSKFSPDDTARIARTENDLTRDGTSRVEAEIHFSEPVTLRSLQILLGLFISESTTYSLLSQNCWFFCSVVLEILSDTFLHTLEGTLSHLSSGKDVRWRIKEAFISLEMESKRLKIGPTISNTAANISTTISNDPITRLIPVSKAVLYVSIEVLILCLKPLDDTKILTIILREDIGPVKHHFLLIESETAGGRLWMRLDQGADPFRQRTFPQRFVSVSAPPGSAALAGSRDALISRRKSEVRGSVHFTGPNMGSLSDFHILLSSYFEISSSFTRLVDGSLAFCLIILSIFSEAYPHQSFGRLSQGLAGLTGSTRGRVQEHFLHRMEALAPTLPQLAPAEGLERPVVQDLDKGMHIAHLAHEASHILFGRSGQSFFNLCNAAPYPLRRMGKTYPTSEHLFHALKFKGNPELMDYICTIADVHEVAFEAHKNQFRIRSDWGEAQVEVMYSVLAQKFAQHDDLVLELLSTGNGNLVFDSDDAFWGVGPDGNGRNELGQALRHLRDKYRAED